MVISKEDALDRHFLIARRLRNTDRRGVLFEAIRALVCFYGTLDFLSSIGCHVSPEAFTIIRWITLLVFGGFVADRRSSPGWIFLAMFAGAEFGHDWPGAAVWLQIFGTIFLRLIKVIIAPLLFSTLVVGIAKHSDLKKLGKMSIKTLTYFEIVSTVALLIGFAAINVTRAGVGIHLPVRTIQEGVNAPVDTASDLIVKLVNLSKRIRNLLHITKVYSLFDVKDDEAAAVASFR